MTGRAARGLSRGLRALIRGKPQLLRRQGVRVCRVGGVRVALDFGAPRHREMYSHGGFEPAVQQFLTGVCEAEDVVVDAGANCGWHAAALLVHRRDVRMVYAYEPAAATFGLLQRTIAGNGLQSRCVPRRSALGASFGVAELHQFDDLDPMHASLFPLGDLSYSSEIVPITPLDTEIADYVAPPAVVKCDVEGGEMAILKGATRLLRGDFGTPPIWLIEANYETAAMAGFAPGDLCEEAAAAAPYRAYVLRGDRVHELRTRTGVRQDEHLVLAVPECHALRLKAAQR